MGEKVGRDHRHDEPGRVQSVAESLDSPCAFGIIGPEGNEVVVVERHTVGAELGKARHGFNGVEWVAGRHPRRCLEPASPPSTVQTRNDHHVVGASIRDLLELR